MTAARSLASFPLEDFFDEYEHRSGLINLASSDALPWSAAELKAAGLDLGRLAPATLAYPDVKAQLSPGLQRLCGLPEGWDALATAGGAEGIALVMHEYASRSNSTLAMPSPCYGAFPGLATLLGVETIEYSYHASAGWKLDPEEVVGLARRCGGLVVTDPHNPSGTVIEPDLFRQVAQGVSAAGGNLIVDQVFREPGSADAAFLFDVDATIIGSLSKVYGLPGLRLGWVVAPVDRIRRLRTVQQLLTLAPSTFAVRAGAAVLKAPERFSRSSLILRNRKILLDWASQNKDRLSISRPEGGTTVCLTMNTTLGEPELFEAFLDRAVLLAPGQRCFGVATGKPWFRLGYATKTEALRDGLKRVASALQDLAPTKGEG